MTDNEIIKALENEVKSTEYVDSDYCDGVDLTLIKSAIDLINCQKTEIEQWKEEANKYQKLWCIAVDDIETAKSEAIQEFAERLKNEIISETAYGCDSNQHTGYYDYQIKIGDIPEYIDNLLKEYEKGR